MRRLEGRRGQLGLGATMTGEPHFDFVGRGRRHFLVPSFFRGKGREGLSFSLSDAYQLAARRNDLLKCRIQYRRPASTPVLRFYILSKVKPLGPSPEKVTDLPKGTSSRLRIASYYEGALGQVNTFKIWRYFSLFTSALMNEN